LRLQKFRRPNRKGDDSESPQSQKHQIPSHLLPPFTASFGIVDDAKDLTATQDFRLDLATARNPITVRWEMLRFGKVEFIIQLGRIWVANGSLKMPVLSEATALETLWAKSS
jgi:hypothetical protein